MPMADEWVCELCLKPVAEGEPHVRVAADVASRKGEKFVSLINSGILVFAVFHSECVLSTMGKDYCEDTEYIWEARKMMEHVDLCDECKSKIPSQASVVPRPTMQHLILLQGGRE